jgi:hypothetical protein
MPMMIQPKDYQRSLDPLNQDVADILEVYEPNALVDLLDADALTGKDL